MSKEDSKRAADAERMERLRPMLQDLNDVCAEVVRTIGDIALQRYGERVQSIVRDELSKAALRIKDALIREIE